MPDSVAPAPVAPFFAALDSDFELGQSALLEITSADSIGAPAGSIDDGDGVTTVYFETLLSGYPGWRWTVSIAHIEDTPATVLETELTPGDGALLSPTWVPWVDRLADYTASQDTAVKNDELDDDDDDDDGDGPDDDESDDGDDDESDDGDDDESDDDESDDDESDDDDDDDLGSDVLHGGDLDGVDIDDLDSDDSDDDESDENGYGGDDDGSDDDDPDDDEDEHERSV